MLESSTEKGILRNGKKHNFARDTFYERLVFLLLIKTLLYFQVDVLAVELASYVRERYFASLLAKLIFDLLNRVA